jgi:hypothetical protein
MATTAMTRMARMMRMIIQVIFPLLFEIEVKCIEFMNYFQPFSNIEEGVKKSHTKNHFRSGPKGWGD